MRVAAEAGEEPRHLLVHHGVARDGVAEVLEPALGRQLAVEQQVADLDEVGILGQLLDRIAAIEQHALVAVDVGDLRGAVGGRGEPRVVGEASGVAVETADVDDVGSDGARSHRQMRLLVAAEGERCALAGIRIFGVHGARPSISAACAGVLQCATRASAGPRRGSAGHLTIIHFALRQDMPRAKASLAREGLVGRAGLIGPGRGCAPVPRRVPAPP